MLVPGVLRYFSIIFNAIQNVAGVTALPFSDWLMELWFSASLSSLLRTCLQSGRICSGSKGLSKVKVFFDR